MNLAKKLLMTTGVAAGGNIPSGGYVDDVFSTYLYTGKGSTQTINNGIDLAGEGGLVWIKSRTSTTNNYTFDWYRGANNVLYTNSSAGNSGTSGNSFLSNGFSTTGASLETNVSGTNYVSWTFRIAPKFFDVVPYTGNGVTGRKIAHRLGVQAGFITVKSTSTTGDWNSYHRSATGDLKLNLSDAQTASRTIVTAADANTFTVSGTANNNGVQYIAYVFTHDPSADGIIQCGSFTGNTTVNIGWEPQWIMIKRTDATGDWIVIDSMRGCSVGGVDAVLNPNLTNAESVSNDYIDFTATGFITKNLTGTHIYTVIRRPNKPPTTGAQVYNGGAGNVGSTFPSMGTLVPDMAIAKNRTATNARLSFTQVVTRLIDLKIGKQSVDSTNDGRSLLIAGTGAETTDATRIGEVTSFSGYPPMTWMAGGESQGPTVIWGFRRAPGFFDVVCDTGTGAAHAIVHGLGAAPQLEIRKARSAGTQWEVWHSALGANEHMVLNSTAAKSTDATAWNSTLPTSTTFTVGTSANTNASGVSFVTYLFATLPGISKVGSYNGNGGTQTIPCGFTTGSGFILIKRIDNTGDWFVWDTPRGITPTTDPHLSLNTTAAEVTTDDSIDQDASGFVVNQNAATNINALGGNYLFLAIA